MFKKMLFTLLALAMLATVLTACTGEPQPVDSQAAAQAAPAGQDGLYYITTSSGVHFTCKSISWNDDHYMTCHNTFLDTFYHYSKIADVEYR
jgi:ABC-type glycerol-3-phosphate transport system substrate-binding protein